MRVCVIGNSHVAALKMATTTAKSTDCHFDFFAIAGAEQPKLTWEDGRIHALDRARVGTTVAEAAEKGLDLAGFDAAVVSGCGWIMWRHNAHHPLALVCPAGSANPFHGPDGIQIVSTAVFEAVVEGCVRWHATAKAVELIAKHFSGRVLLQPWPAPSRALRADPSWFLNSWYGERGPRVWHEYLRVQYRTLEKIANELGPAVSLLPYPLPGPLSDGFMAQEWCVPDQPGHANARYGGLVLAQIRKQLS